MTEEEEAGNISFSALNVTDAQKLTYEKALKHVTLSFTGGKDAKSTLKSFLKQCSVATHLCKPADVGLLHLGLISKIQGEPQLYIEDLNLDTWNEIVLALKEKYGEPETFSQRLYSFLNQAQITKNESSADYGQRVSSLLSHALEALQDEPQLKNFTVPQFLQHLVKIFFIERGNQHLAQYLCLFYKDYTAELSRIILEAKAEEQKLKGYVFKSSDSTVSTRSTHAHKNNSKSGMWCSFHAKDTYDTKNCKAAPTCTKCGYKGHEAKTCRVKKVKKFVSGETTK